MAPKYKAVIFDLFGTLVDNSTQEYERNLSQMAAAITVYPQDLARLWNETWERRATGFFATIEANLEYICRALDLQVEAARITGAAQIWLDLVRCTLIPRPGAIKTLTQLRETGYKIGLISDCGPNIPLLWEETPLAPLVDTPIFSCIVGLKKPDPRIYQLACERLDVVPQNCLYVGDGGSHELTGASQVGMYPVLIYAPNSHRRDEDEWQGFAITELKDVLDLVS